jgi:DNA polymerase (family 10)
MENAAIARLLADIADLLEVKGENAFKVRAYRNASWTVADCPERLADQPPARLRDLPGIGRDLAARIREAVDTGGIAYHRELLTEFPPGILDVLRLQGVGPKTVALLHAQLGIGGLDDLEAAARAGRLRGIKGMGAKKEALVLKAIEERRRFAGRHLLPEAAATADALLAWLRPQVPAATLDLVGSLRRGAETVGDLDILACGAGPAVMDAFTRHPLVERVLAAGDTKSSVLLAKGYQADLRLVPPASRGAAQQYFTGSKAHNIALRDRALQRGWKLNEYGLYANDEETPIAGEREEGIYAALGLDWVPPELRECRGEIEAAAAHGLPHLVSLADIRGDLHAHTEESDGRDTILEMARAARDLGYEYLAITDHSQALAMANGLDEPRALQHAARIRAAAREVEGLTLLAGIECDIRPDGTLDLADDCLAQLDVVVASVHSAFAQSPAEMTARVLRALENRWVDVLGHPTGRLLLRREPYGLDLEPVIAAAARLGVALEINCQADRLDLNDAAARLAHERGAGIVIATDAHSRAALGTMRWGVTVARRAWLPPEAVWNTRGVEGFRAGLRRNRARG